MSDNIQQTFGLDVSQALEALTQLDSAFARFAGNLNNTAAAFKSFNASTAKTVSALGGLGSSSASAASSVSASNSRLTSSFQQTSAQSQASIGRMTTSLQLLSRIVFTQAVVRALNTLRRTFQETAAEATEFQRQIALTRTIDDSGQSFAQLAGSVRSVSDAFNIPLLEVAGGLYQTISNQVGDAAQSLQFLTEASKFAKATDSSLTNSVDLLSGALKSYNLSVDDAGKVSSIFFKTIDLGRVSAQSLGNTFGRVGPVAAQLGVSLEETGSAIAAISVKGSNTAESLTQFRGILTGLLKPTKEMKAALAEMGFSSAEIAIQTLGLSGVLNELANRTGGSSTAMAKLFQNVRGLSGATSLTADGLKSLSADIDEMTAAGRNFTDSKFLEVTATDGAQLTAELNKLHNALVTGLGQDLLKGANNLIQFAGGADGITKALESAVPSIGEASAALLLLQGRFIAARAGAVGLAGGFGTLALAAGAFAGGNLLGNFLENKRSEANLAPLKQLEAANKQGLDGYKAQLLEAQDADNKASKERLQNALQFTRELNKTYLQQQADLQASQKIIDKLQSKKTLTTTQAIQLQQARQTVRNTPNPLANVQGVSQLAAVTGANIANPDQLSRALIDAEKRAEELRAKITEALSVGPQARNLQSEINSVFDQINQKARTRNSFGGEFSNALRSQFTDLDGLFKKALEDGKVTEKELTQLIEKRNEFGTAALAGQNPLVGRLGFASSIELLDQALAKMQQLQKLPTANIGPLQQELQGLEGVLILFAPAATAMERGAAASAQTATNYERAAAAAQQLNARPPVAEALGGLIKGYSEGGFVQHLAAGGQAKGTDTIPALLTQGEMVINAQSTRRFLPQLQAINAGVAPSFRGGDTINQTVGDIIIQADANPKQTARAVADAIRREQRRGTVRQ